jgi:hypothetical protein
MQKKKKALGAYTTLLYYTDTNEHKTTEYCKTKADIEDSHIRRSFIFFIHCLIQMWCSDKMGWRYSTGEPHRRPGRHILQTLPPSLSLAFLIFSLLCVEQT